MLVLVALEERLRNREHVLRDDALGERRLEVVVDDDDAIDLLLGVELGDAVRDRLGVLVAGAVAEAGPRLVDLVAAEAEGRRTLLSGDEPGRLDALLAKAPLLANASRRTCALNAPASPRSPVSGRIAARCTSRRWSSGTPRREVLARATPTISSCMRSAYGRIASIRVWARRSFAAATSSIARVIFRVFLTERTRRLMSWTDATWC